MMSSDLGLKVSFDHGNIGIVVTSAGGDIVSANKWLLKQFGYKKKELVGQHIEMLFPKRFRNKHASHRKKLFNGLDDGTAEKEMDIYAVNKLGEEFPVELSLTFYSVADTQFAAEYITDISPRKASEKTLQEMNARLEESIKDRTRFLRETVKKLGLEISRVEAKDQELQKANSYLNSIWDYAGAIIITTDRNGKIELFNHAAEQLLGYEANEVVGKYSPLIFHDAEEIKMRATKLSEELKTQVPAGFETFVATATLNKYNQGEWTYINKTGRRFPVNLTVTALKNADKDISGFLGIAFDISARKKAEVELQSALQKEKEVNELKSRFVSIASHEFRTPLSTIVSSAYLISQYKHSEDQEKRNKHIERILSSANMLTDILNDLLSVGKIEEGKIQVRETELNLPQYFNTIVNELASVGKQGQIIHYDHEGQETVLTDPSLLKHIIFNLVSNAVKFSPDGTPIQIKTENLDHKFILLVKDNGIGIPEEDQVNLFDLFYRASNANHIEGTGLGLHIIKRYTEMLHGDITCKSKVGEGTVFEISFNK